MIFTALGFVPSIFIIPLLAFYVHASMLLNRAPYYDRPEAKDLGIYTIYAPIIYAGWTIVVLSTFVWIVFAIIFLIRGKKEWPIRFFLFSALGYILSIQLAFSWIFEWFVD